MKRFLFLFISVFAMPLAAQTLSCDTSACGTRVNDFEEQQCRANKVLACKGYNINAMPTIELEIQSTSELVYLSVGDLPHVSLYPRHMGKTLNISHLFANGLEPLRVQAFTEKKGRQYSLSFTVRYNGQQLYSISCNPSDCDPLGEVSRHDEKVGPFFDRIFEIPVNSPVQHEQYSLSFSGLSNEFKTAVYINDIYTGLSIQQAGNLRLPPGEYRIGVGVSSEKDVQHGFFQGAPKYLIEYTGKYYEQRVQVATDLQNFANLQPLDVQDVVRVAVVPIQTVNDTKSIVVDGKVVGFTPETFTLTQDDINRLSDQINKTVTSYVQPLSYNLQTWDVKFESLYTQPVSSSEGDISASDFVRNHRPDLLNKYDVIIAYYGNPNHLGAAASDGFIHLPNAWVINNPSVTNNQGKVLEELPLEVILHETNHVLEQQAHDLLRRWNGFGAMDGAGKHGYQHESGKPNAQRLWVKPDYMDYNRDYMRGQVIASNYMSMELNPPAPVDPNIFDPSEYRYVGPFGTLRNGLSNLHDTPAPAFPAVDTYRIYNAQFAKYLGATASPSVTAAPWNLQSSSDEYVHLQNGLNTNQFLHLDESGTKTLRSTNIPEGSWSSHWIPVKVEGRTLLKSRWTGEYLALTDATTLTAVTNAERQILPIEQLAWEFIPHAILNNLSSGYSFIKSAKSGAASIRVHVENGAPEASVAQDGWHSAHWSFTVIDGKYVKITNRWQIAQSLHIENGLLQASDAPDGWHSAQWELESVTGLANTYRLKNRHEPTQYLNIDGTTLKSSVVPATDTSTYWTFPKVSE